MLHASHLSKPLFHARSLHESRSTWSVNLYCTNTHWACPRSKPTQDALVVHLTPEQAATATRCASMRVVCKGVPKHTRCKSVGHAFYAVFSFHLFSNAAISIRRLSTCSLHCKCTTRKLAPLLLNRPQASDPPGPHAHVRTYKRAPHSCRRSGP